MVELADEILDLNERRVLPNLVNLVNLVNFCFEVLLSNQNEWQRQDQHLSIANVSAAVRSGMVIAFNLKVKPVECNAVMNAMIRIWSADRPKANPSSSAPRTGR